MWSRGNIMSIHTIQHVFSVTQDIEASSARQASVLVLMSRAQTTASATQVPVAAHVTPAGLALVVTWSSARTTVATRECVSNSSPLRPHDATALTSILVMTAANDVIMAS
ncbi:hypothetical protein DPMN_117969 [Dreissena polymorpha]|uniref:Uncharacterized protein n=1 Tax=Dreissena polymorpha TaxID=45954 RepID=A0A9D4JPT6_DREPO|nr:hypothetical protein DPMN_117969 [Dreissena polymorpha]